MAQALKQPGQAVTGFLPVSAVAAGVYAKPNVAILKRKVPQAALVLFGVSDGCFQQRKPEKGLITKREVRAVSLARMQLTRRSVVWDIGAGSGSVGLEAARLCVDGHVYAIEKNVDDLANIEQNHAAWGISNYSFFHGKAPQYLDGWPDPDAVFIGGSGGELTELIGICLGRLRPGRLAGDEFCDAGKPVDGSGYPQATWCLLYVCQIQASRSSPILDMNRTAGGKSGMDCFGNRFRRCLTFYGPTTMTNKLARFMAFPSAPVIRA